MIDLADQTTNLADRIIGARRRGYCNCHDAPAVCGVHRIHTDDPHDRAYAAYLCAAGSLGVDPDAAFDGATAYARYATT